MHAFIIHLLNIFRHGLNVCMHFIMICDFSFEVFLDKISNWLQTSKGLNQRLCIICVTVLYFQYYSLCCASFIPQGSHRHGNFLNLEGLLEKSLKVKSALKSTGKLFKGLEKSLNSTILCRT